MANVMSFLADRKVPRVVACLGQGATTWLPIVDIMRYCLLPLSGSLSLVLSNEVQPVEVVSCSSFLISLLTTCIPVSIFLGKVYKIFRGFLRKNITKLKDEVERGSEHDPYMYCVTVRQRTTSSIFKR
jgi:hypothetical protein